jgi:hypothetical protein
MPSRSRLSARFLRQQSFAAGYSPLYARLFGTVASWLTASGAGRDPLVTWLLEAAKDRRSLDTSLLLASGLHRDILAGEDQVSELARYYPTVGGDLAPDAEGFEESLRAAILARSEFLAHAIQHGRVQTNETGRELCWLLPSMLTEWTSIHLVDLGASAGLNLVADQRSYRLIDTESKADYIDIGQGKSSQFVTQCSSVGDLFDLLKYAQQPDIESRTGCDAVPFKLDNKANETMLKSFIWGDQVDRMERLCEGIDSYQLAQQSPTPVNLYQCQLPEELNSFLDQRFPVEDRAPVVIYNTYMTAYLARKGRGIADQIGSWASRQKQPVMWLQWEPARDGQKAPSEEWIAWTSDMWQEGNHRRTLIGWVHPHGGEAIFEIG